MRVVEFVVPFRCGWCIRSSRRRRAGWKRRIDGRLRAKISIHSLAFCAPSAVTATTGIVAVVAVIVVTVVVVVIVSVIVVVVVVSTSSTSSAAGVVRVRWIIAIGRRLLLIVVVLVPTIRRRCL